ncbi:zinc-binding dehydrogenase [Sulfitobacter sp. D35]|uniref:zinc-binding dehydrogenase n=1 Tax=Sulfitobacter sp. D35 TaxID=3083252 RepID=UPI00297002B3|nr:zinc-binding dehydrogenase [Sulfitobacter sp. D35]MDW4497089.1 zinc-binding dehydrogenase [Sulfitobacter sp. D35]
MKTPKTMKGMVLIGHGGLDRLVWREDLTVPEPGPGEVLVAVAAAAVNNTDINTRTGWYSKAVRGDTAAGAAGGYGAAAEADGSWSGAALAFPRVQGADGCGRIVATGADVSAERIGQRVLLRALQATGDADLPIKTLGSESDGTFAEYVVVSDVDAVAIESDLSDVELASFPCAFSTAEGMIQRAGLGAERVLVTGASGGVGSAAIQLAKRRGAHVTALTSPDKATALRSIGADETLDRNAELPGRAFDVVLDLVGGPRWGDLIDALRHGGRYAVAGAIAGPIVELDLRTLYLRDLSLFGCTYQPPNVFTDLVGYIEAGEIRPVIAETFPLHEMRRAQEVFLDKGHVGKIGLTIA